MGIIESLHSFKAAIPRKKKQALQSKVAGLSDRKETGVKMPKAKKKVNETLFFYPKCNKESEEEPERYDENSNGCDVCNNWFYFKCVSLTGKYMFMQQEKSA